MHGTDSGRGHLAKCTAAKTVSSDVEPAPEFVFARHPLHFVVVPRECRPQHYPLQCSRLSEVGGRWGCKGMTRSRVSGVKAERREGLGAGAVDHVSVSTIRVERWA